ncbi:type I-E CRISPR-associated protein Cse2/CasB [Nocardia sp. SYP-A9097]|uniref:type I-E CRISPR-associated protein Cse2/CasB n=1 Tax=Nocardia sp. SYP-A9097 TaxID=2663237 RepID=UPI001E4BCBFA|nr:type I-E CRISPR-associated protein Cse2/CasB [Nocardia sp. SYP-A9097]
MPQRYWNRFIDNDTGEWKDPKKLPPGEDLAALRAGLGRDVLTVPKMWPFYTSPVDDELARIGEASARQRAEHAALALYGLHQQSQRIPMHRKNIGLGTALLALRRHDNASTQAVDRRVAALATATSVPALLMRMRGLVGQLRDIRQPLDYDRLLTDLAVWPWPDGRQRVRRSWAQGYQLWEQPSTSDAP